MIRFVCVRSGRLYDIEYVERLQRAVSRWCPEEHEFICLTDQPERLPGHSSVDISRWGLQGWWAKMHVFDPMLRGPGRTVYLDLDTVVVGDLTPLVHAPIRDLGICANFTRAVQPSYPCRYGSCVMVLEDGWGDEIWQQFWQHNATLIPLCGRRGDQYAIERLKRDATILQDVLPPGFMVGRRDFGRSAPPGASLMIFAGKHKPHNTPHAWLRRAWNGE